ncbi:MAG: hypothetical protein PHG06_17710 [Parabacteroides sp.]|nr:hypothetical protein [Parabacteroides sp.]
MKKTINQLAAEERRKYHRQWRAANKDKVKRHNDTYWKRRAEKNLTNRGYD